MRCLNIRIAVLVSVIVFMLLFSAAPAGNYPPIPLVPRPQQRSGRGIDSLKQSLNSSLGNFRTSFEMKENVDFLLTPALLVQESISEDCVITYP